MSPIEQDLLDLMLDEITIEHTAKDSSGNPITDVYNNFTYQDPVTVKCQIVFKNEQVLDSSGREIVSRVHIILGNPDLPVSVNDRITLPDGSHPAILGLQAAKDDVGPYWKQIDA